MALALPCYFCFDGFLRSKQDLIGIETGLKGVCTINGGHQYTKKDELVVPKMPPTMNISTYIGLSFSLKHRYLTNDIEDVRVGVCETWATLRSCPGTLMGLFAKKVTQKFDD